MMAVGFVALCSLFSLAFGTCVPESCPTASTYNIVAPRVDRDTFVDALLDKMNVEELVRQLHLTFADNVIGPESRNELYNQYAGKSGVGVVHDWYPTNKSQYNDLQKLNLQKSRLPIPFLQMAECLHGIGSFQQSLFPVPVALSATFDPDLMYRVGRAIGEEATSIGIHACYSPVLDLGKDTRWGRVQEGLGEDFVLTTHMGVAYASGLSKNGSWSEPDAVVPVMKHFAGHGSPQGGLNAAPYTGFGWRQIQTEMLVPFKAVVELGGARGVMMAYHDIDGIPAIIHPDLYDSLDSWGFDGFHIADDGAVKNLQTVHAVADSPASAIAQWLNAGGGIQYYDYPLPIYQGAIEDLVNNNTVSIDTLRKRARGVLNVKWDLGLFDDPYIPDNVSESALTAAHEPLALEAALHTFVLLENRNSTLPLNPKKQGLKKIALVGPFADTYNFGDYSGLWGAAPIDRAYTIRQGIEEYLAANASDVDLSVSWGANSWLYNAQYPVPRDLLVSTNGTQGGLTATYYHDTNFLQKAFEQVETPNRQWGLYPPNGLASNNFSATWEGSFSVASDAQGWLGIAIGANSTGRLLVDGKELVFTPYSDSTGSPTIQGNILPLTFAQVNATAPPPGAAPFNFTKGANHTVRIEFQVWNTAQKFENVDSLNAQVQLFWNLVDREDPVGLAKSASQDADVILFAGGAAWNSDGESGDRATMGLSPNQTALLDAMFELGKPVVILLHGGRPFAIPEYYAKAAAVLYVVLLSWPARWTSHCADVFGLFNPGGRIPLSIPYSSETLPAFYNYKQAAHQVQYLDTPSYPSYSFGYGLSYTTFNRSNFQVKSTNANPAHFTTKDTITFCVTVKNTGEYAGSDVPQVYLLRRVSQVVQPLRQMVAFQRVYLDAGVERAVQFTVDVDRFLKTLNRQNEWELEKGSYVFALTTSDHDGPTDVNATLQVI